MYYIYILKCEGNSLYTGIASDVVRRFSEHCSGSKFGAKYTKAHKPECIEMVWCVESRSQAARIEAYIKKLSKELKCRLIASPEFLDIEFPKSDSDSNIKVLREYCGYKNSYSNS